MTARSVGGALGTSNSNSNSSARISINKAKSAKALLLSSKVKSIKNRMAPYQLQPHSNDEDDDVGKGQGNHQRVEDADDIDETEVDLDASEMGIDETEVDLDDVDGDPETGSVHESRKLPSPSSPASVVTSNDTIFYSCAEEESGNNGSVDSSINSKSKASSQKRASPSSWKANTKTAVSPSHKKRSAAATGTLYHHHHLAPEANVVPSAEELGYEDFNGDHKASVVAPARSTRRRGSTGKLVTATKDKGNDSLGKSEHTSRKLMRKSVTARNAAANDSLGKSEHTSRSLTRGSKTAKSSDNSNKEGPLEARKATRRRRSAGRLTGEAASEAGSKENKAAISKEHRKARRQSTRNKDEKSEVASEREAKFLSLVKKLGSASKPKRRGSTGSSYQDDIGSAVNLKDASALRPARSLSRKSILTSATDDDSIGLGNEKLTKGDQPKEGRTLHESGEGKITKTSSTNNSSCQPNRNDKRSLKNHRLRNSKSFDEANAIFSTNESTDSKENSSERPDRKHEVAKRRSKFVNQKNLKVAHINRRSRRNLLKKPSSTSLTMLDEHHASATSGSISSLTQSTGFASKDDMTLSPCSSEMQRALSASDVVTGAGQRAIIRSRWQALPKREKMTSADDTPVRPEHDLSSVSSPARACAKARVFDASEHTAQIQKVSHESEDNPVSNMTSIYPEIQIPATPCRSAAGFVSELSNPDCLITPGTIGDSARGGGSLQSKLHLLPTKAPGAQLLPYLRLTPRVGKQEMSQYQVPETPGVSIALREHDTPGGFVSELTNASSLQDSFAGASYYRSSNSRGKLSIFMTGTQTTLLHEGEYNQDQIPRMVRRHSLDSVSFIAHSDLDASSNDKRIRDRVADADHDVSQTSTRLQSLMNDNTPRAPSRQRSHASTFFA